MEEKIVGKRLVEGLLGTLWLYLWLAAITAIFFALLELKLAICLVAIALFIMRTWEVLWSKINNSYADQAIVNLRNLEALALLQSGAVPNLIHALTQADKNLDAMPIGQSLKSSFGLGALLEIGIVVGMAFIGRYVAANPHFFFPFI